MSSLVARALAVVAPPFCWSCGGDARVGDALCGSCRRELRWLGAEPVSLAGVELWAPLAYEGPARPLVRALKYRGAVGLAGPMAAQMTANAPDGLLRPPAELVPVPLHPTRRRHRGFNQAERLADALARRTGLRVADCLRRRGSRTRQVGRDRAERLTSIAGTVGAAPGATVPGAAILVDDVVTTGATLAACASALRDAGAAHVAAIAYARTPGR